MKPISTYFDYRQFLKDWFEAQKQINGFMSYRYMAAKVSMDPSHIVKIFHGQLHLSDAKVDDFVKLCDLNEEQESYFRLLVLYNKARNEKEQKIYLEKLLGFTETETAEISRDQYMFFTKWYYTAIWCALDIFEFKDDFSLLGNFLQPAISAAEAQEGIELLQRLHLVEKTDDGIWRSTDLNLSTGENWRSLAIQEYQKELMRLSVDSLERFPKEQRDISTLSLVADATVLEECRIITAEYRKNLQRISNQCKNPDRILQINVQTFPLTSIKGAKK